MSGNVLNEYTVGKVNRDVAKQFDPMEFNILFEQEKERKKRIIVENEDDRLNEKNYEKKNIKIYKQPIGEIINNGKDVFFNIFDDVLNFNVSTDTFTRDNGLFYVGLFLILVVMIIFILNNLFTVPKKIKTSKNINIKLCK